MAVASLLLLLAPLVRADYVSFYFENDLLDPVDKTDRWYTDGWRLTYGFDTNAHAFVGQNMYTPQDISVPLTEPPKDDRAYNAWLYGGYGMWYEPDWVVGGKWYVEGSVGVTGPSALGEETQKQVHEWVDSPTPMGWHTQSGDRIAAQLHAKYQWAVTDGNWQGGVIHVGTSAGSVNIGAEAGLLMKVGYGVANSTPFDQIHVKGGVPALYTYVGTVARYIAYDYFLMNSDVHPRDFVVDYVMGVVWETPYSVDVTYQWTHRTRQFNEQTEPARFGSIAVRCWF
jgi:hypothetical protein